MKTSLRKIFIAYLLVILVSFTAFVPKKSSALLTVYDPVNASLNAVTAASSKSLSLKEWFFDIGLKLAVQSIMDRMVAETIRWANGGFDGNPAFVSNPAGYFKNIADGVAGQLIFNNPNFRFMCSPFRARVQLALKRAYVQPYGRFQCTLTGIARNFDGFMNDFSQGGWDSFIQISQNSNNNPIGLYNSWQNQLISNVDQKLQEKQQRLNWGEGFLSFEECDGLGKDLSGACIGKSTIKTPGSVIESQLNQTLNIGNQGLVAADEINEMLGAILGELTNKVLGAGGLGSLGGSSGSSYSGNLLDEAEKLANQANQGQTPVATICTMTDGSVGGSVDKGQNCYKICSIPPDNRDGLIVNGVCIDVEVLASN